MHTKFVGMHFFLYFCSRFCARTLCAGVNIIYNIDEKDFTFGCFSPVITDLLGV